MYHTSENAESDVIMGFRNAQLISQLASKGMLNVKHSDGVESISFPEFGVLKVLAESTADYPLDEEAKRKNLLPRTYMYGWLSVASSLGMTLSNDISEIQNIGGRPRNLKKETAAINRISRIVKKLEAKGLVKCLRQNSYSQRLNSVWLLTIGTKEENAVCEQYVRARLSIAPSKPESTPSITQTVNQTASAASLLPRPPAIITAEESPTSPTPPTVEEEQQDDTPKEKTQAPVRHFIGFRNQT